MLITVSRACRVDQNNGNMIRHRMRSTALQHSSARRASNESDRETDCVAATCTVHHCSRQTLLLLLLLDHFVQIRWCRRSGALDFLVTTAAWPWLSTSIHIEKSSMSIIVGLHLPEIYASDNCTQMKVSVLFYYYYICRVASNIFSV